MVHSCLVHGSTMDTDLDNGKENASGFHEESDDDDDEGPPSPAMAKTVVRLFSEINSVANASVVTFTKYERTWSSGITA